jgi:hypothetical protein
MLKCMPNPKPPSKPRHPDPTEVDPVKGNALLKRMLQTKPKPHQDMMAERKAKRAAPKQGKPHK